MRVVHVSAFRQFSTGAGLTFGGLERFLAELVPAQRRLGLDVGVLDVEAGALIAAADAIERQDWAAVARFAPSLAPRPDDVFHIHDWYGAIVLESLFRAGHRRLVMTAHLPLRRGFTYRDVGLSWAHKYLLEDRCLRGAALVTVPSEYLRRFMAAECGLDDERLRTVPHGVDLAGFRPGPAKALAGGPPRLLAVGRFTAQKGFELLVRAFATIAVAMPDARLEILGDGDGRGALLRLIERLGLSGRVVVLPARAKAELAACYAAATLLVMPSQFEPFGLVGLEAMSCGCPVLAIEPSGATEYLHAGETTGSYSPARLGRAIVERLAALRDPADVAAAVRARAEAFTWERAAAAYAAVYRECAP